MREEDYKAAEAVRLETLADVNDLGKPWRYEEDGLTVTRTCPWSPPGCHPVGCGLKLYVNDEGRLVKVEGDENHPVTQGRLCPRCIALKDYVYNPARILVPLKRDRADRGKADAWEECSWDEAFGIVKENYERICAEYGPESIIGMSGTGREGGTMSLYPTMVFGTPNYCYMQSGYACYTPRLAAAAYITGTTYAEWDYSGALPGRWDDERYELTECLVIWGKAPLESNPDGFFGHAVVDAMRRGMRIIQIDPRVNWLSARADILLQLRRHRARHGHAGHHHRGGPLRPRLRRVLVLRLRPAGRARAHDAAREGRRDLPGAGGEDLRRRPHVRHGQAGRHPMGPCRRPEDRRHAEQPVHHLVAGHHRQPGPPRRPAAARFGCGPQRAGLRVQGVHTRRAVPEDDRNGRVPGLLQHDLELAG